MDQKAPATPPIVPGQAPRIATPPVLPGQGTPPAAPPSAAATPPVVQGQPVQSKKSGCLTGGLIVGALIVVVLGVGGFLAWRFISNKVLPQVEEATGGLTAFSDAPPGPCIDLEGDNGVLTSWSEVSCDGPRQAEVTYSAAFNDGPFPGDQYLADNAASTCRDAFEGYVGISPDQSSYDFSWIVPTAETWATGIRQGICLVISGDGGVITGEVKGSNQ